ncbi:hypothetical protein AMATHDRAFT_66381 [Amanita thiersii Skay4041]|uniref:Uncharacterized protein n=1 Tax=Amanita thiersii Skay4041 TaxID=703135 RepID=A0A2A9NAI9_9AGAR|nr:hypothetical protein AMATHDRAFT_66381 [Amanita thiersii Skay4041]
MLTITFSFTLILHLHEAPKVRLTIRQNPIWTSQDYFPNSNTSQHKLRILNDPRSQQLTRPHPVTMYSPTLTETL